MRTASRRSVIEAAPTRMKRPVRMQSSSVPPSPAFVDFWVRAYTEERVPALATRAGTAGSATVPAVFLDCDGVLFHGSRSIPGSMRALSSLLASSSFSSSSSRAVERVVFLTNNASSTRRAYSDKIKRAMRAEGCDVVVDDGTDLSVLTAGYASAWRIATDARRRAGKMRRRRILVIGEAALVEELRACGVNDEDIEHLTDSEVAMSNGDISDYNLDDDIGSLLLGHDSRFSYRKICIATQYLSRRDEEGKHAVDFYVSNMDQCDVLLNNDDGDRENAPMRYMPATGALAASIISASGRSPDYVCGKPSSALYELIMEEYCGANKNADGSEAQRNTADFIIVGDRLETDIAFGARCGFTTVLALTGVSSAESLQTHITDQSTLALPDHVVPDLHSMVFGTSIID